MTALALVAILVEHGLCAAMHHDGHRHALEEPRPGCCSDSGVAHARPDATGECGGQTAPCPCPERHDCDHCRSHEHSGWTLVKSSQHVEFPPAVPVWRSGGGRLDARVRRVVWAFPLRPSPWVEMAEATVLLI